MFKIIISKYSNFLFFARKADKNFFNDNDLRNYLYNKNIDLFFYNEDDKIWNKIKKVLGEKKYKQFKKSIASQKNKFSPYWQQNSRQLFLWKSYFESNYFLFKQIIYDMKNLCDVKHFTFSRIPVYLIFEV